MDDAQLSAEFPNSQTLRSATYHPLSRSLRVIYRGGKIYDFEQVDRSDWFDLVGAESPGRFLAHHIRSCHSCRNVADERA